MNRGQKTILVLLSSGEDYSMQKFAGIQRYANKVGWHIQMVGYSEKGGGAYCLSSGVLPGALSTADDFQRRSIHPSSATVRRCSLIIIRGGRGGGRGLCSAMPNPSRHWRRAN